MSITITRGKFTNMGMPLAQDRDRDTDWWSQRDDLVPADLMVSEVRTMHQIHALLDMDAPASQVRTHVQTADVLDEVADALVGVLRDAGAIAPVAVLADLDMSAPAKQRRTQPEIVPTREPDFFDEGMAWWISDLGVVGFEVEHHEQAAERLDNHGFKVRRGILPSECGFVVMPHDDTVWSAGMGRCNLAYTLWTLAADAVAVTA